jgi:hypothetical protein
MPPRSSIGGVRRGRREGAVAITQWDRDAVIRLIRHRDIQLVVSIEIRRNKRLSPLVHLGIRLLFNDLQDEKGQQRPVNSQNRSSVTTF